MGEGAEIITGAEIVQQDTENEPDVGSMPSHGDEELSDNGQDVYTVNSHLFIEQYRALRSEIDRRIEIRQQILYLTLLAAGTFLAYGVQPVATYTLLLFYPILALFLAALWSHNDLRIGQINYFIRMKLEPYFDSFPTWEKYRRQIFRSKRDLRSDRVNGPRHPLSTPVGLIAFSTRGIFLATQILAVLIVCLRYFFQILRDGLPAGLVHLVHQGTVANPAELQDLIVLIAGLLLCLVDIFALLYTRYIVQHRRG